MIEILIANQQTTLPVDADRMRRVVEAIVSDSGIAEAEISIAIVDDLTLKRLHDEFMQIDEPTDVMSFTLERTDSHLDGEIVASADTALTMATALDAPPEDELLLYVVHGALHLVGYDDIQEQDRLEMRRREREYLGLLGVELPWRDEEEEDCDL